MFYKLNHIHKAKPGIDTDTGKLLLGISVYLEPDNFRYYQYQSVILWDLISKNH